MDITIPLYPYYFGVQKLLSVKKGWKGVDTVIFAADFIAYALVGVSLSDTKYMEGEYLTESCMVIY